MDTVLKLRELRRLRGLCQKEVAFASGVGLKTLSSFESGARIDSMKLSQLTAILKIYGVSAAEFFGESVEAEVFAELEQMSPQEITLIRGFRTLPDSARTGLLEKFLTMIEAAEVLRPNLRIAR